MELLDNNTNDSIGLVDYGYPPLEALGPKMQAFLIALYSLTALLALGGNTTVVVVLMTGKRSSRELRLLLINLALSDITMAVFSIPFTYTDFMFGQWIFHPSFCPFVQFMQHCSVIVSVYTLTAIGVDRYYAIMYPLNSRCTKSRGNIVVICIWLMGISLSSVQFVHGKAVKFTWDGQELYDCTEEWTEVDGKVYTVVVFVLTFVLPMIILMYTYTTVGWKMWRHTSPGNADATRDYQQFQAKVKVVKMLAIVVLLFAACWLPIQILNLLLYFLKTDLIPNSDEGYYGYVAAFFSCHWLSMANSFVNPFIYCFMSDNFRADLKQFIYCCWPEFNSKTNCRCMTRGFHSTRTSSFHSTSTVVLGNNTTSKNSTKQIDIVLSRSKKGRPAVVHYTVEDP